MKGLKAHMPGADRRSHRLVATSGPVESHQLSVDYNFSMAPGDDVISKSHYIHFLEPFKK